jgi:hypothetical protein
MQALKTVAHQAWVWWSLAVVSWFADIHNTIIAGRWSRTDFDALVIGLGIWTMVVLLATVPLRRGNR